MKRYLVLLVAAIAIGAVLAGWARRPHSAVRTPAAAAAVPIVSLDLTIANDRLVPEVTAVPKGHRVALRLVNRGARPVRVTLAGYEDEVVIPMLSPGERWSGEFLAERPGDDFAWLLDGRPVGRLSVQGSHLVEGHR